MNWFKQGLKRGVIRGLFTHAKIKANKKAKRTGLIWHVVYIKDDFCEVVEEKAFTKAFEILEEKLK